MGDQESPSGPGRHGDDWRGGAEPDAAAEDMGLGDLFEDLEQQAAGIHLAERDAELVDRARGEYAHVSFSSRVHASRSHHVALALAGGQVVEGALTQAGTDWCVLTTPAGPPSTWLVRLATVETASGMSPRSVPEAARPGLARLSFGSALHRLANESTEVLVRLVSGVEIRARVVRIGADFVEAQRVTTEPAAPSVVLLPFAAISAVRTT